MESLETEKLKPSKGCSGHCCSLSRCGCAFLIVLFLALTATVVTLAVLYAKNANDDDTVVDWPSTTAAPSEPKPWENHRLPTYILPDHYDLTLHPDFYDGHDTFSGDVKIRLNVTAEARYLLVHVRDLTVTRTRMWGAAGMELGVRSAFHEAMNEYWVVEPEVAVTAGSQVSVQLEFSGSLVNGIVGLYKSVYVDSRTNETKHLATSKFQPTDARKAFPCLDEPGFKSTYTTTLVHRPDYKALSNMPIESTETRADGLVATHFQKSVPMVTYLKCFIVCQFDYKENTTKNGTPFRVYATPDKIDQVDYSLDIGVKILEHFETYYGLDYPLPKLDMIAIPDFVSGAMEHWGLITYRETNLLYEEQEASLANKQRVAVVVSHELAHMWFGNLVTMNWWDDLWLNEGFASFVEYIGVDHVHPSWDMKDVFVATDLQGVMPDDSIISSHPIVVPVDHPSEITEVFDSISYSKGASVIRMLESFMGEDKFIEGLQTYMEKYQYKTTVTDDLWRELESVPDAPPVKTIMDTWTRQMGYPVVTVRIQGNQLSLTQERFLLDPNADKTQPPSPYSYRWHIPIRYQTPNQNQSQLHWMDGQNMTLDPSTNLATDWVKLNLRQEGFYRVNYPQDMWERLAQLLANNHQALSPSDRSGLIDDIFNLASADLADYGQALSIIQYMGNEEHLVPWDTVSDRLAHIDDMLVNTEHYELWQRYIRSLASPVLKKQGYEDTGSHLERQMRAIIINLACGHDDMDCRGNMTSMFRDYVDNGAHISPNIRSSVYRFGMESIGQESVWDAMWVKYTQAVVPQEKRRLLYAVTQTREPWLILRLLEYSMDPAKIRDQDFFTMIAYLGWNDVAFPLVWDFVREKWPILVERFDIGNRYLGRMVPGLVEDFNTESKLKEVTDFFAKYPEAGAGARARQQALEQIQANIAWMQANLQSVVTWLQNNVP